jgi:hypothetical protein
LIPKGLCFYLSRKKILLGIGRIWGGRFYHASGCGDGVTGILARSTAAAYIDSVAVTPETTTRELVSLPNSMVQAIEELRFQERVKTESQAIRDLIEIGVKVACSRCPP